MIVYPDIELQNGRCVNLARGQHDDPVIYDAAPLEAAHDFVSQGAEWLHVVDLDAVFGVGDNVETITDIIQKAGCCVQVAGAVRTIDAVRKWIDAGAGRVVIATAAVKDPSFVTAAAHAYPDQIVVSIDARDGKVAIDGWRETTAFTPKEFARQFEDTPLAAIIFTDIDRDEDAPDSSMAQTADLAANVRTPVIASGVVKSIDDISTLNYLPNIAGAITGRALFGGALDLGEAVQIATAQDGPVAQFA
ncbi:MAG: HisA/HisF-related TIM barrel protein [Hyphomicrobiaceae bacterium]